MVEVDYCSQGYLDWRYGPGQPRKCYSQAEADALIDYLLVEVSLLTEYFDSTTFDQSQTIKFFINNDIRISPIRNLSQTYEYKVSENYVTLKDSWITNIFHDRSFQTYSDVRMSHHYHQARNVPAGNKSQPLISIQFKYDEDSIHYTRQVQSLTDIFTMFGGLMGVTITIASILLAPI